MAQKQQPSKRHGATPSPADLRAKTPAAPTAPVAATPAAAPAETAPAPTLTGNRPWWPYLMLASLTLLFFWDHFLTGKIFVMRDTFCDCFPWRVFAAKALWSGQFPLWNPYSLCGQPYLANPQTAVLYPLHGVFLLFPPVFALKLWVALHVLVAAAGMYALARHWRLEAAPALLAGVAFGFSTHLVAMLEFQSSVAVEVFTPLAVLLASLLAETAARPGEGWMRRAAPLTALLALLYATIYLAGHQQAMINGLLIVGIYLIARCLAGRGKTLLLRIPLAYGVAGALAIGLCLPQMLMMLELLPLSIRGTDFDPGLRDASFHPVWILNWIFPFLPGRPSYGQYWWADNHGLFEYWAGAVYMGILPLICLTAALPGLRRGGATEAAEGPTRRFLTFVFLGIAAFGLLMALGKYTPVYMFFYTHIPIFNKLRWPSKFLQLVMFAAAVLAGLGFQNLLEAAREKALAHARATALWARVHWLLVSWGIVFAVLAIGVPIAGSTPGLFTFLTAGAFKHDPSDPERLASLVRDWRLAALFLGLTLALLVPLLRGWVRPAWRAYAPFALVLLAFVDAAVASRRVHPLLDDDVYRFAPDASIVKISQDEPCRMASSSMVVMQQYLYGMSDPNIYKFTVASLSGETALPHGVFRVHGGDVLKLATVANFRKLNSDPDTWRAERAFALMNLRYFMVCPPMKDVLNGRFPEQFNIAEIKGCLPRALVAENWRVMDNDDETSRILMSREHDPWRTVLLGRAPEGFPAESAATPPQPDLPITRAAEAGVESIRYRLNRVDLVATAKRPSVLLLTDTYYPGWKASVDGQSVPILRANILFRAVMLQPGTHKVSFVYQPTRFYWGLAGAMASLLLVAALGFPSRWRRFARRG